MKKRNSSFVLLFTIPALAFVASSGCKNQNSTVTSSDTIHVKSNVTLNIPDFNADSAYSYIKTQVAFGPRVPNSKAHEECLQFFIHKLTQDSLTVTVQRSSARTFDGKTFDFQNVIASSQPKNPNRIVLFGHWDTRPFADEDSVEPMKPFDAADDGGSSAAVLLEIARHLHNIPANIGIDLVFLDLEDYGQEEQDGNFPRMQDSWCLGSQYWAKNLPQNYTPRYGILLDMVGAKNAVFPMEGTSMHFAPDIVNKIWNIAAQMGYSNSFTRDITGQTTDDHLYINTLAGIPTIDIVDYRIVKSADGANEGNYPYFHHTHADKLDVIDTNTLKMVGNLLMNVIYSEKAGAPQA